MGKLLIGLVALMWISGIVATFVLSIWGAVIAFQSSIGAGIVVLIVEPLPFIVGITDGVLDYHVADSITGAIEHLIN